MIWPSGDRSKQAILLLALWFGLFLQVACSSGKAAVESDPVQASVTTTTARIIVPSDQAIGVDPYVPFAWDADTRADNYQISVGTSTGASDVWISGSLTGTSVYVPGLQPNTPYHVRLQANFPNNTYGFNDSVFTTATGLAHLTSPVDGATDVDPSATLSWNAVLDAQMYNLYISENAPGLSDVYNSGDLPNITSFSEAATIPNTRFYGTSSSLVPPALRPNTKYYARLVTKKATNTAYVDSTFTTGQGVARLVSNENADGRGAVASTTQFSWNRVEDADPQAPYSLSVGSRPGLSDIWATGSTSETTATLPQGLLQPNSVYYVRLATRKKKTSYVDSTFSTGSFPHNSGSVITSRILTPTKGATGVDPLAPISWSSVPNAQFILYVGDGTQPGVDDRNYVATSLSSATAWVGGLLGGKTYYATLITVTTSPSPCSMTSPCYSSDMISFTTATLPLPHNKLSFYQNVATATAAVRDMALGHYNLNAPDTFLANNSDPAHGGAAYCSDFANNLVVQLQNLGIVARARAMIFGAGPGTHGIVEYYDPFLNQWAVADPTFGILYYDPTKSPATLSLNAIAQALVNGSIQSVPFEFVTSQSVSPGCPQCFGNYWTTISSIDPILLYLNPIDLETGLPSTNDPTSFMIDNTPTGAEGAYIFQFRNLTDSVSIQSSYAQVQLAPSPPPVYVRSFGNFSPSIELREGWTYLTAPPAGMSVDRTVCPLFPGPDCP
jgi:hypothetical protein